MNCPIYIYIYMCVCMHNVHVYVMHLCSLNTAPPPSLFLNYSPRFITGVIPRERLPVFERVLRRVCHGNVFLREAEIEQYLEDPSTVRVPIFKSHIHACTCISLCTCRICPCTVQCVPWSFTCVHIGSNNNICWVKDSGVGKWNCK